MPMPRSVISYDGMERMTVRSTARRLGFSDWRKADSEDLCRWLEASTPHLAKNIAPLSRSLLFTVLQALGKAGWGQLFPDDVLLAAEGDN